MLHPTKQKLQAYINKIFQMLDNRKNLYFNIVHTVDFRSLFIKGKK